MLIAISSLIFACLSLGVLLWFNVNFPDNPWLESARRFQTLIGAVLGFVWLAGMFVIADNYEQEQKNESEFEYEAAFLDALSLDLFLLIAVVEQKFGPLKVDVDSPDKLSCLQYFSLSSKIATPYSSVREMFSEQIPTLSPEAIELFFRSEYIRNSYRGMMSAPGPGDCASDGVNMLTLYKDFHSQTLEELLNLNGEIADRANQIRP